MFAVTLAICLLVIFVVSATDLLVCHIDTDELNDMGVRKKTP